MSANVSFARAMQPSQGKRNQTCLPVPAAQHLRRGLVHVVAVGRGQRLPVGAPAQAQAERAAVGVPERLRHPRHDAPVLAAPDDDALVVALAGQERAHRVPGHALDHALVPCRRANDRRGAVSQGGAHSLVAAEQHAPVRVATRLPALFQIHTVLSKLALASSCPSGDQVTSVTLPRWPCIWRMRCVEGREQGAGADGGRVSAGEGECGKRTGLLSRVPSSSPPPAAQRRRSASPPGRQTARGP